MSTDLHDELQRARDAAPAVEFDLPSIEQRRHRKLARRRTGALILGLSLTAGIAGVAFSLADTRRDGPAVAPAADATLGIGNGYWYREEILFHTTGSGGGPDTGTDADPDRACILRFQGSRWIAEDWSAETVGEHLSMIDGLGRVGDCDDGPGGYSPGDGEFENATFGANEFPHSDPPIDELPTDPQELAAFLIESSAAGGSSPVPAVTPGPAQAPETGGWVRVLRDSVFEAPPELQPGFYWFGRQIPGMAIDESAVDPTGRAAIKLSIVTEFAESAWYFDPERFQVLASVVIDADSGELWQMRFATAGGLVAESGAKPSPGEELVPAPLHDPEVGGVSYPMGRL